MIDNSCWCMVDVDGQNLLARILHLRRGKFRIEEHAGGQYNGRIIDASDVISCNVDKK